MKIKRIGTVPYADLDQETQTDVALSIGFKTGEIRGEDDEDGLEEVRIGLDNGQSLLPLVLVDPKALLKMSPGRSISKVAARKYARDMSSGVEFPPIVIDSDLKKDILMEGGHRTLAASMADLKSIKAVDIAGIRGATQEDGLEIYVFPR